MNNQARWWERIPPLFLILLGLLGAAAKLTGELDSEAMWVLAGVLIGAGIVLEALHHR